MVYDMKGLLTVCFLTICHGNVFKEPAQETSKYCKALPQACHPRDAVRGLCSNTKGGYLVWGRGIGPSGGVGNDFIYWPSVFASSLLSGRMLLIDDISEPHFKIATICNSSYLDCQVPMLSSLIHTGAYAGSTSSLQKQLVRSDVKDVLQHSSVPFLRVDGFYRNSNWWQHNRTLARCMRNILNCSEYSPTVQKAGRHLCVERAAMRLMVGQGPGTGLHAFAGSLAARLVGDVDRGRIRSYLTSTYRPANVRPLFDASIHLRLQFSRIEADGVSSMANLNEVLVWLNTDKHRDVFETFSASIRSKIESMRRQSVDQSRGSSSTSTEDGAFKVYLTSDSEVSMFLCRIFICNLCIFSFAGSLGREGPPVRLLVPELLGRISPDGQSHIALAQLRQDQGGQ